ncbi:hypothetical protein SAMN04488514_1174 [Kriegella aquimaris]|uniref:Uncharacterized protein n=1 Tax=Kriegella aquimaris TaxID=192904 RepID=A0A1G9X385_9FLAO|nr:hypothetical protein SAMN04488514_1174 [Kriegella aquimaris]
MNCGQAALGADRKKGELELKNNSKNLTLRPDPNVRTPPFAKGRSFLLFQLLAKCQIQSGSPLLKKRGMNCGQAAFGADRKKGELDFKQFQKT